MQATKEPSVVVTLELSEEEALWLKTVMQNPVGDEDSYHRGMRRTFFDALQVLDL